jgi:hypothetical protein
MIAAIKNQNFSSLRSPPLEGLGEDEHKKTLRKGGSFIKFLAKFPPPWEEKHLQVF